MNRDPFLRLALIALCTAYFVGVVLVAEWLGDRAALSVLLFGVAASFAVSYEPSPKKPETDPHRRQRQPAEGTRGFLRPK